MKKNQTKKEPARTKSPKQEKKIEKKPIKSRGGMVALKHKMVLDNMTQNLRKSK